MRTRTPISTALTLFASAAAFAGDLTTPVFDPWHLDLLSRIDRMRAVDLDGDGRQEVIGGEVVGNDLQILFAQTDGSFRNPPLEAQTGAGPQRFVIEQMNGDAFPDFVTANRFDDSVTVLLTDGAGGIANFATFPIRATPIDVAVGDSTGDGFPDAHVIDTGGRVLRLAGNAFGGLGAPAVVIDAAVAPLALAADDFDGDGRLDLALLDGAVSRVVFWRGAEGAAFIPWFERATGPNARELHLDDLDGTGRKGVLVLDDAGLRYWADVTRDVPPVTSAWPAATGVVTADLRNDGHRDAVALRLDPPAVLILPRDAGGFGAPLALPLEFAPVGVTSADTDGDGFPDLAVAAEPKGSGAHGVRVLRNDGSGGFPPPPRATAGAGAAAVLVDVRGRGVPDLIGLDADGAFAWSRNDGTGSFGPPTIHPGRLGTTRLATGDIDGDGVLDIVAAAARSVRTSIVSGDQIVTLGDLVLDAPVSAVTTMQPAVRPAHVVVATGRVLHRAAWDGAAFARVGTTELAHPVTHLAAGPLLGGPNDDLIAVGAGQATVLVPDEAGGLSILSNATVATDADTLHIADLTDDGIPDLIVLRPNWIDVHRNLGEGTLLPPVASFVDAGPTALLDADADGDFDVLRVDAAGVVNLHRAEHEGCSPFFIRDLHWLYPVPVAGRTPTVGDVDGNGYADLLVFAPDNGVAAVLRHRATALDLPCPGDVAPDGIVDALDLERVLMQWGPCPKEEACPADTNRSGIVDLTDLLRVLSDWGACP